MVFGPFVGSDKYHIFVFLKCKHLFGNLLGARVVWYGMVWYGMVWNGIWYGMVYSI